MTTRCLKIHAVYQTGLICCSDNEVHKSQNKSESVGKPYKTWGENHLKLLRYQSIKRYKRTSIHVQQNAKRDNQICRKFNRRLSDLYENKKGMYYQCMQEITN